MIFSHISDTHAGFPTIPEKSDFIVHSGDMLPDLGYGGSLEYQREAIKVLQYYWVIDNIDKFKTMIGDKTFLFCLGNHDFLPGETLEFLLTSNGIKAIDLTDKLVSFNGYNFYGFPYINYLCGEWNYERDLDGMEKEVYHLRKVLESNRVDILIAHSPIYGVMDDLPKAGNVGNVPMKNMLETLDKNHLPLIYCCGHIHLDHRGNKHTTEIYNDMVVSNAARHQNQIEIKEDK